MSAKPLISAPSPAPAVIPGDVLLHHRTWYGHIKPAHSTVLLGHVRQAINDPCEIAESKTVPGTYLLLNHSVALPSGEKTLRVPLLADPQEGTNLVTSAYYSDATNHGNVVWRRGDV